MLLEIPQDCSKGIQSNSHTQIVWSICLHLVSKCGYIYFTWMVSRDIVGMNWPKGRVPFLFDWYENLRALLEPIDLFQFLLLLDLYTPYQNSHSPWKINGLKISSFLYSNYFSGYASFRKCGCHQGVFQKGFFQRKVAVYYDLDMMWNSWPPILRVVLSAISYVPWGIQEWMFMSTYLVISLMLDDQFADAPIGGAQTFASIGLLASWQVPGSTRFDCGAQQLHTHRWNSFCSWPWRSCSCMPRRLMRWTGWKIQCLIQPDSFLPRTVPAYYKRVYTFAVPSGCG